MISIIAIAIVVLGLFVGYSYFSVHNIEKPSYTVVAKTKNIEIRQYQPMLIATTTVPGDRREAANRGFRIIANFIFGDNKQHSGQPSTKIDMTAPVMMHKNAKIKMTAPVMMRKNEKIAMTAPVLEQKKSADSWAISFVMPSKYNAETLPQPNDKNVKIETIPSARYVVIKFSGTMADNNLKQHRKVLENYVRDQNLNVTGEAVYAFYNPPWTLPWMRRNEIMLPISNAK